MGAISQAPRWTRGWEAIVDAETYPLLAEVLRSERAAEAREELERLLGHFWQERAERHHVRRAARLVLPGNPSSPLEIQTIDVSETGALVSVPYGNEIDVMTAAGMKLLLPTTAATGPVQICYGATLVRMAGLDDHGVRLGLRFDAADRPSPSVLAGLRAPAP